MAKSGASHGLAAALAPVISVAEAAASPFAGSSGSSIGALGEDGSTRSKQQSQRRSKRKALLAVGKRSVSPFRSSSSHKRSSSATRLMRDDLPQEAAGTASGGTASDSATKRTSMDRPRSSYSEEDGTTSESDDGFGPSGGLCPRNNAFVRGANESQTSLETVDKEAVETSTAAASRASDEPLEPPAISKQKEPSSTEDAAVVEIEEEEEEWDPFDIDPELLDNTLYNAGCLDIQDGHEHAFDEEISSGIGIGEEDDIHRSAPNVVMPESQAWKALAASTAGDGSTQEPSPDHNLVASRPIFERNRCTITLVHGQYEKAVAHRKRPKRYVVASDGSSEAAYATEWTIGTVLRDGDEALIVSVMETDSKLDSIDHRFDSKATRTEHQKIRQNQALILARQATALLQRTRLGVKISCQALHAKNARHMLLDLIDFFEPTLVVVGSRGLGSLKGILLGSTSHYLVQKSSVPVMIVRKRLRLPQLPKGKAEIVAAVKQKHRQLRDATIEKESNVTEEDPEVRAAEEEEEAREAKTNPSETQSEEPKEPERGRSKER